MLSLLHLLIKYQVLLCFLNDTKRKFGNYTSYKLDFTQNEDHKKLKSLNLEVDSNLKPT